MGDVPFFFLQKVVIFSLHISEDVAASGTLVCPVLTLSCRTASEYHFAPHVGSGGRGWLRPSLGRCPRPPLLAGAGEPRSARFSQGATSGVFDSSFSEQPCVSWVRAALEGKTPPSCPHPVLPHGRRPLPAPGKIDRKVSLLLPSRREQRGKRLQPHPLPFVETQSLPSVVSPSKHLVPRQWPRATVTGRCSFPLSNSPVL